jgi:hypothetical protein
MTTAARLAAAGAVLTAAALAILAPAGATPASCGARDVSQPFLRWLDPGRYFLLPGGDFESGPTWSMGRGARIVSGNEPFYVHSASDTRSLLVPAGTWARSPSTCVDQDEPTVRFFVRNTGSVVSMLVVEARIRTTLLGGTTETTLPLGVVVGTARAWQPSLPVVFQLSLNQLLGGTTTIDFRFIPLGLGGEWQIDDVYVDPFKDRAPS